jgi:2-methylcitrate dehydratase PrpD
MSGEALRALAGYAAELDARRAPRQAAEAGRACLLYALAVGAACLRAPQAVQAAAAVVAAPGTATRFFDDSACDPAAAGFANATLFHARVQDDAHPAGHVGVVVVPAALGMAQATGASGALLLSALLAGYETALRIGRDHAADLSARGFRTTPAYGVFGAAAAAGRLLGLDARAMANALGLAASMAGGLREFSEAGSEDFAFQAGNAAANGITAARLAAAGARAAPSALDGRAGFYRAFGEAGRRYDARVAESLGIAFEITRVTYKPYPICQFHRGIVEGCAALRSRAGARAPAMLTVRMHPFEADFFGVRFAGPFSTFPQTFMSAPFCAALAWSRGDATFAGLNDFGASDVLELVPRVSVVADEARERYAPRLEARLADGELLAWEAREKADAYLLDWDAARRMARRLADEVAIPGAAMNAMVAAVAGIEDAGSLKELTSSMRAVCAHAR